MGLASGSLDGGGGWALAISSRTIERRSLSASCGSSEDGAVPEVLLADEDVVGGSVEVGRAAMKRDEGADEIQ